MKRTIRYIISALGLCLVVFQLHADIGETHQLKQEREKLEIQIKQLMPDSAKNAVSISQIQDEIMALDKQIFASYDETIDRISAQNSNQSFNNQLTVYLAFTVSLIALFLAVMLFVARTKLNENGHSGFIQFYRQLTLSFAKQVAPDKTGSARMLRINIVVLAGLILMSISILSFLIKSL